MKGGEGRGGVKDEEDKQGKREKSGTEFQKKVDKAWEEGVVERGVEQAQGCVYVCAGARVCLVWQQLAHGKQVV